MPGILVRQRIIPRITEQNMLENCDLEQCLAPASYELRVGSYFDRSANMHIELSDQETVFVSPGGFALIGTLERVHMPNDIVGFMYLRSTYARRGYVPWFMGLVDPGYEGGLTLTIHNLTSELIPIHGHERICHLVFEELEEPVDRGYEGAYQHSAGATPPAYVSKIRIIGTT